MRFFYFLFFVIFTGCAASPVIIDNTTVAPSKGNYSFSLENVAQDGSCALSYGIRVPTKTDEVTIRGLGLETLTIGLKGNYTQNSNSIIATFPVNSCDVCPDGYKLEQRSLGVKQMEAVHDMQDVQKDLESLIKKSESLRTGWLTEEKYRWGELYRVNTNKMGFIPGTEHLYLIPKDHPALFISNSGRISVEWSGMEIIEGCEAYNN